ncbi:MAG: glycosyltransferase family 2 protein [Leptolyngbya sp.]|nr:glycosyltransferase family 2 protein [Leptolyngbya sp.]
MLEGAKPAIEPPILFHPEQFPGFQGRRLKAAVVLASLWLSTLGLHLWVWGHWFIYGCTVCIGLHLARLLFVTPVAAPAALPTARDLPPGIGDRPSREGWPHVSILVAAKNERAVIERLVASLTQLDYPSQSFDLWMIDDHSTDGTAELLDRAAARYPNVHVVHRSDQATGGKSGALNEVWPRTQGSVLVVFDADAQVPPDLLRRVVPWFHQAQVGAVQVRKAIANADLNFWTRGQMAEMAFDAYCQQQRVFGAGIGELRGNGQFVRREALLACGGWNEATITDDLDLTFRLHLTGWSIPVVVFPAVQEEGVTQFKSLWHQRNRWAEGGYQRYLDYWRLFTPNRLGIVKTLDLGFFWLIQYALPTMAVPDLALALVRSRPPVWTPLSSLVTVFLMIGMVNGLRATQKESWPLTILNTLRGVVYMVHWIVVMATVTLRMAIRPKRLRWIKTDHQGLETEPGWLDLESVPE